MFESSKFQSHGFLISTIVVAFCTTTYIIANNLITSNSFSLKPQSIHHPPTRNITHPVGSNTTFGDVTDATFSNPSWLLDRPIIFIGDSLMRFQYLSLAFRILYGDYQHNLVEDFDDLGYSKNVVFKYGGYNCVNELNGAEIYCDLDRPKFIDTRIFRHKNVTLAYFGTFETRPANRTFKGRGDLKKLEIKPNTTDTWTMSLMDMLKYIDDTFGQSFVIYNDGIWQNSYRNDVVQVLMDYVKAKNSKGTLIWKETLTKTKMTYHQPGNKTHPFIVERVNASAWKDFDEPVFQKFRSDLEVWSKISIMRTYYVLVDSLGKGKGTDRPIIDHCHLSSRMNQVMNDNLASVIRRILRKKSDPKAL